MIDHSVYPDVAHGDDFADDFDRADYVQRVCAAGDFGIAPDPDAVALLRGWRAVFDAFPLPASPTFHALRAHYGWPALPIEPALQPARWEILDALEGREDPCRERA